MSIYGKIATFIFCLTVGWLVIHYALANGTSEYQAGYKQGVTQYKQSCEQLSNHEQTQFWLECEQ